VNGGLPAGIQVLEHGADAKGLWARLRVEVDSPCFHGHFEGHPVLPGIAQLGMVLAVLGSEGRAWGLDAVRVLKLKRVVRPGEVLELRIGPPGDEGVSSFETRVEGELVASGRVATSELAV